MRSACAAPISRRQRDSDSRSAALAASAVRWASSSRASMVVIPWGLALAMPRAPARNLVALAFIHGS
eukprot:scaffold12246_cov112-Isochrysis_galbana.AAC.6